MQKNHTEEFYSNTMDNLNINHIMHKTGRGGKRIGSGRKPGLITKTISFRIKEDLYIEIKNKKITNLNTKFTEWITKLN